MTGKGRDLAHRWVLPNADLVLDGTVGKAVRRDKLVGCLGPHQVAYLSRSSRYTTEDTKVTSVWTSANT